MIAQQGQLFLPATAPYQAHSATSKAAAVEIVLGLVNLRAKVYNLIASAEEEGVTDEEGMTLLGMVGNTYRPRRRELQQAGLVEDSGKRRKTRSGRAAVVWIRAAPSP